MMNIVGSWGGGCNEWKDAAHAVGEEDSKSILS